MTKDIHLQAKRRAQVLLKERREALRIEQLKKAQKQKVVLEAVTGETVEQLLDRELKVVFKVADIRCAFAEVEKEIRKKRRSKAEKRVNKLKSLRAMLDDELQKYRYG